MRKGCTQDAAFLCADFAEDGRIPQAILSPGRGSFAAKRRGPAFGDEAAVQVLQAGDAFRLAIDAPRSMLTERAKVYERKNAVPECIRRAQKNYYAGRRKAQGFEVV